MDAELPDGTPVTIFAQCDEQEHQHFTGTTWQVIYGTHRYFTENNDPVHMECDEYFLGQLKLTRREDTSA